MYFRLTWVIWASLAALTTESMANDKRKGILHASPTKCVALNQGRTCYADVVFDISAPEAGDYCLRESESKRILQCWANTDSFSYTLNFGSVESVSYELIAKAQRDVLAVTTIEVNWVHKVRTKKRRWRLF
ncbi:MULTISPECIES: DUF3019 domain-containing protein [Pseudoalteromonas]|uniref:DUF3019 domain-containing protein n=1 Tax=Pseudoalteromonas obscura TaxID=3048491 RepID=A0ABT7EMP4_9GAMM|nr:MULTISPECIES: DUF3019 domain-containing protein [Pseudoalteromonas]MBQ4838890.1 DUF3019 domain-containing protein [Pseudoalteromonas luteoviolacea]MDK2596297.1 DUF3019 domain-containing protein [Pseudoalteromonas sp. P94(2023)]